MLFRVQNPVFTLIWHLYKLLLCINEHDASYWDEVRFLTTKFVGIDYPAKNNMKLIKTSGRKISNLNLTTLDASITACSQSLVNEFEIKGECPFDAD